MSELSIALRDLEKHKQKHKDDEYGISCYESAIKVIEAFEHEMEEGGHSGFSASITKNLIISWLSDKPIYPIDDDDFREIESYKDAKQYYYGGVFKTIYPDGRVEYNDVNRVIYHDTYNGKDTTWSSGIVDEIVDEYVGKITMPYRKEKIHVYGEDKYLGENGEDLTKDNPGETNSRFIKYILKEDGTKIIVNKEIKL